MRWHIKDSTTSEMAAAVYKACLYGEQRSEYEYSIFIVIPHPKEFEDIP